MICELVTNFLLLTNIKSFPRPRRREGGVVTVTWRYTMRQRTNSNKQNIWHPLHISLHSVDGWDVPQAVHPLIPGVGHVVSGTGGKGSD